MKHLRRFLAVILAALLLCTCVTATGVGDDNSDGTSNGTETGSITLTGTTEGKEYRLYKIFDMQYVPAPTVDGKPVGEAKVSYTIANAWKNFFKSEPGSNYLIEATGPKVSEGEKKYLTPITVDGTDMYIKLIDEKMANDINTVNHDVDAVANISEFAQEALEYAVGVPKEDYTSVLGALAPEDKEKEPQTVVEDLAMGYYLIYPVGATNKLEGSGSLCSLTSTTPEATIKIKATYPPFDKSTDEETFENKDSDTTELTIKSPHAVGDVINFTLTSAVPDMTGYDSYIFRFSDRMNPGFAFNSSSVEISIAGYKLPAFYDVVVKAENGEESTVTKPSYTLKTVTVEDVTKSAEDAKNAAEAAPDDDEAVKAAAEAERIYAKYKDIEGLDKNTVIGFDLEIKVYDLVKDGVVLEKDEDEIEVGEERYHTIVPGDEIVVSYSATITESALVMVAENEATLEYSNDPTDSTKTEKTPPEKVRAYTAVIEINKVDAKDETPLEGAKFILRQKVYFGDDEVPVGALKEEEGEQTKYYKYQYYKWFSPENETPAEGENLAKVEWVDWYEEDTHPSLDEITVKTTEFVGEGEDKKAITQFDGLAAGTYELIEIEAPYGYNLLTEPVTVTVKAPTKKVVNNEGEEIEIEVPPTELSPAKAYAVVSERVENNSGSTLPGTGGMGTTIFYVVGGLLMVVAFVLLVTKKRMGADK